MAQKNEKKTTTAGQLANSFKIAFSMYSKIPMPQSEWSKENMRYVMCFLPLIGAVIGFLSWIGEHMQDCLYTAIIFIQSSLF